MLRLAAHLPDAAVGLTPCCDGRVDLLHDQRPHAVVEAVARAHVQADRVEQHAPHVVLPLVPASLPIRTGCAPS